MILYLFNNFNVQVTIIYRLEMASRLIRPLRGAQPAYPHWTNSDRQNDIKF